MLNNNQAIIIDNGSDSIKTCFDNLTFSILPSIVGTTKYPTSWNNRDKSIYVCDEAKNKMSILNIRKPVERGNIKNWDDIEKIWNYIFEEKHIDSSEHPVIITEPPNNAETAREKTVEIMFETFNVGSFYMNVQGLFSLYSVGRTTGITLDIGHEISQIVPVYENNIIRCGTECINFAGSDLTLILKRMLYYCH